MRFPTSFRVASAGSGAGARGDVVRPGERGLQVVALPPRPLVGRRHEQRVATAAAETGRVSEVAAAGDGAMRGGAREGARSRSRTASSEMQRPRAGERLTRYSTPAFIRSDHASSKSEIGSTHEPTPLPGRARRRAPSTTAPGGTIVSLNLPSSEVALTADHDQVVAAAAP